MSALAIETHQNAAAAAVLAGDFDTALTHALAAKVLLAGMADTRHGDAGLTWPHGDIDSFIRMCERRTTDAAGRRLGSVRRTHFTFTRPGDTGDYA